MCYLILSATQLIRESQDLADEGEIYRSHRDLIIPSWKSLNFDMCHYIFSQVEDLQQATLYVSFVILAENVSLPAISSFFDTDVTRICTTLGCLASVIHCQGNDLVALHPSLPDFLFDEARSQAYHINPTEWTSRLCVISLLKFAVGSKGMLIPSLSAHYRIGFNHSSP